MVFEDNCGGWKCLFSSTVPVFYTCRATRLLTLYQILVPFGIFNAFRGSCNHVATILLVAAIYILLFVIEKLVVQLDEPFYIFTMQCFCNNIYNNVHKIIGWYPNKGNKNVERWTVVTENSSDIGTGRGSMPVGGG